MSAPSARLRVVLIAVATWLGWSSSTLAQMSDDEYAALSHHVSVGDTVYVTTHTAGEIRGRLVHLSADSVVVASGAHPQAISFRDIGWIEKRGDPLWNGALIGGGLLAFPMMAGASASCSPDCSSAVPAAFAVGLGIGAGIGALIDSIIPGRTLVYGHRPQGFHGVLAPSPARSPETQLISLWNQVSPGDKISVHTTAGTDVVGRFVRASASSTTVAVGDEWREVPAGEVTEVLKYRGGTHVKKGLVIGIPLGALMGSNACYQIENPYQSHSGSDIPCGIGVLLGAAGGGAVGALIGGMTFGSTVVYSVAPVASAHRVGVVASFTF